MKKYVYWLFTIIVLYSLQTSILPGISYKGISPDLLLLLVISYSLIKGEKCGIFFALCLGLLKASASGTFFGIDAFSFALISFSLGKIHTQIYQKAAILPVFASIFGGLMHFTITLIFIYMLGFEFSLISNIENVLIPTLIYQAIFSYPIHRLALKIDGRL